MTSGTQYSKEIEEKILALIIKGKSNNEIAQEIGLAVKTIKDYCTRVYKKHGVTTRVALIIQKLGPVRPNDERITKRVVDKMKGVE